MTLKIEEKVISLFTYSIHVIDSHDQKILRNEYILKEII